MTRKSKSILASLTGVLLCGTLAVTVFAQESTQKKAAAGKAQPGFIARIGQLTISTGRAQLVSKRNKNPSFTAALSGGLKGAANAEIKSVPYDIAAPKITLTVLENVVSKAVATGGVHVAAREDGEKTIDLRGSTATYFGETKDSKGNIVNPSRLEIRGNVRGTYRSPQFSATDPLNVVAEAVDLTFPDADTTTMEIRDTLITGTPVEPPKDEKKDAGKKPKR